MSFLRFAFAFTIVVVMSAFSGRLCADELGQRWSVQLSTGVRQPTLNKKHQPWVISPTFGARFLYRASESLSFGPLFNYSRVYNDSVSTETFKIGREEANEAWTSFDVGAVMKMHVYTDRRFMPYLRFGMGLSFWQIESVHSGDVLVVEDGDGNDTEYKATELFLLTAIGANSYIHPRWSINYNIEFTYLTGIGADFDTRTEDFRSRGYANFSVGIAFHFGSRPKTLWERWRQDGEDRTERKEPSTYITREEETEAPLDTVRQTPDDYHVDSDNDGVRDDIDLCPDTPREADGLVDETGCPTDVDSDGVPDYLDDCFDTPVGMTVDSVGCPLDQDGDGVSDDRDLCIDTPSGFPVDNRGCVDRSRIFYKRILHIDYPPGGSDIDQRTAIFLDSLVHWLKSFPEVEVEITGYTDNIGSRTANQLLSQKRAEKVKNYLVLYGIDRNRITAVGRGMTDFIASNETREGRARNRRIELLFSY